MVTRLGSQRGLRPERGVLATPLSRRAGRDWGLRAKIRAGRIPGPIRATEDLRLSGVPGSEAGQGRHPFLNVLHGACGLEKQRFRKVLGGSEAQVCPDLGCVMGIRLEGWRARVGSRRLWDPAGLR